MARYRKILPISPHGNLISGSSPLACGGGAFQIEGNPGSTSSQTFASTTLSAGGSTITAGLDRWSQSDRRVGRFYHRSGGVVINGPAIAGRRRQLGQTGAAGNGSNTGNQAATATITTTSGTANQRS